VIESQGDGSRYFGSDVVADFLSAVGIDHVAMNAGATLRGLHDSLLRRNSPEIISTLHEEIAIGIAHGYAKAAGRPMAAAIHDHVGPMHAHMALFNAWADDVPMLVLGGSGPRDTARRRPWLDWIHTSAPTVAPIRDAVKWDCEPASSPGLVANLRRAYRETLSLPMGPVFVALDVLLMEATAEPPGDLTPPSIPTPAVAAPDRVDWLVEQLVQAATPVFVVDRPPAGTMAPLVALAELLGAAVIDLGSRCSFPTTHWADQSLLREQTLGGADLVVVLDPRDLLLTVTSAEETTRTLTSLVAADVTVVSIGTTSTRATVPVDRGGELEGATHILGHVPSVLARVADAVEAASGLDRTAAEERHLRLRESWEQARRTSEAAADSLAGQAPIHPAHLSSSLRAAVAGGPWQLANGLLGGWLRRLWDFESETAYLGRSGGEGLGYGLPASVGAALAHRADDTLVVDVQADGDLLYTPQALWTAAHHRLPLLVVVYDNHGYGRDLIHQRLIAAERGWEGAPAPEGVAIQDPTVGFSRMAEGFGVEGIGPVTEPGRLRDVLTAAAVSVRSERRPVLVHVVSS
jgi:benzoylformate decarboxylase/acetolactate synthase-1/2/3 large subunit